MISSEMPELLGVTDRILVMSNGRVAGIVETAKRLKKKFCNCRKTFINHKGTNYECLTKKIGHSIS